MLLTVFIGASHVRKPLEANDVQHADTYVLDPKDWPGPFT